MKFRESWAQRTWYEKAAFVVGMPCAVAVIVLAMLQLVNVWENSVYLYTPLSALLMAVQGTENLRKSRKLAIFSYGVAVFLLLVFLLILLIK